MSDRVAVRVGDCSCPHRGPNAPHPEGDEVYLRATPSLPLGLAVQGDIRAAAGDGSLLAYAWKISYIRHGAIGWNKVDLRGNPAPFAPQFIIDDFEMGMIVAEKADELYGDRVAVPFVSTLLEALLPETAEEFSDETPPTTSPPGPTAPSTSPQEASMDSPSEPSSGEVTADLRLLTA